MSIPSAPSAAADSPGVGNVVVRTPGVSPESLQNGSPIVIMGPKLLSLSPSFKPLIGLSTTRVSRRLDSGSPREGRTTASANVLPSLVHPVWAPTSGTSTLECIHWARNGGDPLDVPPSSQCSKQLMDAEQSSLNAAPGRLLKPYPPAGDPSWRWGWPLCCCCGGEKRH